ncbi:MAG: dephospho-CoA kinase [Gemmataceae bacterium]|nr:dephospho-CoA kinase [Gemmataceae bacterium]
MTNPKPVIGLIGGIGAGKSTVATALVAHGGRVVAGDPLGHEALEQPDIRARVLEVWGGRDIQLASGAIDRKKLGRIVFPSPVERSRLEHIVHPYIERRIREEIVSAQADPAIKYVVVDAAIMLEAGWNGICDKLIFVDAPQSVRLDRVRNSRGWTEQDLANREMVQMPVEMKKKQADAIVDNGGTAEATLAQVQALVQSWKLV